MAESFRTGPFHLGPPWPVESIPTF